MANNFNYTKILTSSLSINSQDNVVVRNNTSDGYAKQFDRFSANFIIYDMEYLMSQTEFAEFRLWWKDNKALFFDFSDPVDDILYQGRIVDGVFGASPYSLKQNYYSVSLKIERVL